MSTVLVTVVGPAGRLDLAVPAELPVGALLEPLAEAHGVTGPASAGDWSLRPLGEDPLPAGASLIAAGARDGDIVILGAGDRPVAEPAPSSPGRRAGGGPGRRAGGGPVPATGTVRQPAPVIAVLSATAGMGRTTTTALLAGALAARTGRLTVAVDAHPGGDSLSGRLAPEHEVVAGDLLAVIDHPALTHEELLGFLAWAGPRLRVVANRGGRGPPLRDRDWRRLLGGLARHGLVPVVDCPPGLGHPATRGVVATADQLVLLVEPRPSPPTRVMARALAERGLPVAAMAQPAEGGRLTGVGRVAEVLVADWAALGLALPAGGGEPSPRRPGGDAAAP
jgi:WXG100 protein secretion system (Wss), protein YukD